MGKQIMSRQDLLDRLAASGDMGVGMASSPAGKIVVEFSSPNTNKPLHLGHLRNGALGMAIAAAQKSESRRVVAVIGDGALTAGLAFEALNHAGSLDVDMLVILNDNDMSISENVGAMSNYLAKLLSGKLYSSIREGSKKLIRRMPTVWELARRSEEHVKGMVLPGTLFEELGLNYIGPIDGHDMDQLLAILRTVKARADGPVLIHAITKKGKGYAEHRPDLLRDRQGNAPRAHADLQQAAGLRPAAAGVAECLRHRDAGDQAGDLRLDLRVQRDGLQMLRVATELDAPERLGLRLRRFDADQQRQHQQRGDRQQDAVLPAQVALVAPRRAPPGDAAGRLGKVVPGLGFEAVADRGVAGHVGLLCGSLRWHH